MKAMKKILVLVLAIALLASLCLVSCSDSNNDAVDEESTEKYILDMRVIEGELWVLYSDDPENPVSLGRVDSYHDGTEGLEFHLLPDGTYSVSGGTTDELEQIIIPAWYKGKAVTKIHDQGFLGYMNLKSIYLPSSITVIGKQAFSSCVSLVEINMPAAIEKIESSAFANCSLITGGAFPDTLKHIGEFAFANCISIETATIPASVTYMGNSVFINCSEATIKCEPEVKPEGWYDSWYGNAAEVIWGYKAEG